jgi:hypothetical protein
MSGAGGTRACPQARTGTPVDHGNLVRTNRTARHQPGQAANELPMINTVIKAVIHTVVKAVINTVISGPGSGRGISRQVSRSEHRRRRPPMWWAAGCAAPGHRQCRHRRSHGADLRASPDAAGWSAMRPPARAAAPRSEPPDAFAILRPWGSACPQSRPGSRGFTSGERDLQRSAVRAGQPRVPGDRLRVREQRGLVQYDA